MHIPFSLPNRTRPRGLQRGTRTLATLIKQSKTIDACVSMGKGVTRNIWNKTNNTSIEHSKERDFGFNANWRSQITRKEIYFSFLKKKKRKTPQGLAVSSKHKSLQLLWEPFVFGVFQCWEEVLVGSPVARAVSLCLALVTSARQHNRLSFTPSLLVLRWWCRWLRGTKESKCQSPLVSSVSRKVSSSRSYSLIHSDSPFLFFCYFFYFSFVWCDHLVISHTLKKKQKKNKKTGAWEAGFRTPVVRCGNAPVNNNATSAQSSYVY